MKIVGGRGKKSAKFWASHPSGPFFFSVWALTSLRRKTNTQRKPFCSVQVLKIALSPCFFFPVCLFFICPECRFFFFVPNAFFVLSRCFFFLVLGPGACVRCACVVWCVRAWCACAGGGASLWDKRNTAEPKKRNGTKKQTNSTGQNKRHPGQQKPHRDRKQICFFFFCVFFRRFFCLFAFWCFGLNCFTISFKKF